MKKTILLLSLSPFILFSQTSGYRLGTLQKHTYKFEKDLPPESKIEIKGYENKIAILKSQLIAGISEEKKQEIDSKTKSYQDAIDKINKKDSVEAYQTLEWLKIERIEVDILKLKADIASNMATIDADNVPRLLTEQRLKDLNTDCDKWELEINSLMEKKDSLYSIYMIDYITQRRRFILSFGPDRARAFFNIMYDQDNTWSFVQTSGLSFGNNSGSIYSELVNGNMGLFRIGFGVMVSQSNDSDSIQATQEDAYQRLASYGGNTVLKFEYPLAFVHSKDFKYNLIAKANGSLAGDLPAFGTRTSAFAGNASLGVEMYADISSDYDKENKRTPFRFFASYSLNGYSGTKEFQQNLGISNSNFLYAQLSLGVLITQTIKISVLYSFSSEFNLRNKGTLGGQVLPTY